MERYHVIGGHLRLDQEGTVTSYADAQATIAALQSEVKDLKEWLAAYKQSLELAQSSLTQRTAERDTARRRVDELEAREVDVVLLRDDLEQRTAELEAANDKVQFLEKKNRNLLDSENLTLKVKADQDVRLASLQAELERVRGERRCGTCAHWKKIPNCATDNMGSCVFPLPFFVPMLNTWEMSGKDCPTWHAK